MNKRHLAVLLISCVLLLVLVIVGVRFPNRVEEDVDDSDKVLPYSPVMRKPPGVDVNDNGVEDGFESEILDRVTNGTARRYVSVLVSLRAVATPEDLDLFGSLGGLVTAGPWSGALYGFGGNISYLSVLHYALEASNVLLIEKRILTIGR